MSLDTTLRPPARRTLADAFAAPAQADPPARSAALVGVLPPRPDNPAAHARPQPVPSPAKAERTQRPVASTKPAPRETEPATPSAPAAPSASSAADVVRSVAVYLPPELLTRLRDSARTQDRTYADVLVAAADRLDSLTGRFDTRTNTAASGNGGMPTRPSRERTRPGVQTQLRLDGHQIAWLDTAAERLGAPSRSALVVALLDTHLTPPGVATQPKA